MGISLNLSNLKCRYVSYGKHSKFLQPWIPEIEGKGGKPVEKSKAFKWNVIEAWIRFYSWVLTAFNWPLLMFDRTHDYFCIVPLQRCVKLFTSKNTSIAIWFYSIFQHLLYWLIFSWSVIVYHYLHQNNNKSNWNLSLQYNRLFCFLNFRAYSFTCVLWMLNAYIIYFFYIFKMIRLQRK